VRDAEKPEGNADKEGPEPFHFEVGGDAEGEDDDTEDEVGKSGRVNIHFLAPLGGGVVNSIADGGDFYLPHPLYPPLLRGVKGDVRNYTRLRY
jgi:hypothetical protein